MLKMFTKALEILAKQPQYTALVDAEREKISALFEDTFRHNEFTGRSGTFFAYEGLGSHLLAHGFEIIASCPGNCITQPT